MFQSQTLRFKKGKIRGMKLVLIFLFALFPVYAHEGHGGFFHPCHESDELSVLSEANKDLSKVALKSSTLLSAADFYKKFKHNKGLLIKGSKNIDEASLVRANETVEKMLAKRPDIRKELVSNKADIVIIAKNENYCEIPEAQDLAKAETFDGRSFCDICGGGGVPGRPITTVCEHNLLKTDKDPYHKKEDILTHEFAHTIHLLGMSEKEKSTIKELYDEAAKKGMFAKNKSGGRPYTMANDEEFFASFTAVWFGAHNPDSDATPEGVVNRDSIKEKFPALYDFLKTIYPE